MIREIGKFFALPRTAKPPLSRKSAEGITSNIIGDFVRLDEYGGRADEVAQVLTAVTTINPESKQIIDLGYATQEYDQAISIVRLRVEEGSLSKEMGQRFIQTLTLQRRLSFLRPASSTDNHLLTRRNFLIGGLALGAAAAAAVGGVSWTAKETTSVSDPTPNRELQLDLQQKLELTDKPSELSNDGWRIRKAPDLRYWASEPIHMENGFTFHFDKTFGDNGIKIRAWRNDGGEVVPFLRVNTLEGESQNYSLKTIMDKKGDLETEPVFFDNPGSGAIYYTKFKLHTGENKFKFSGYYLVPLPLK